SEDDFFDLQVDGLPDGVSANLDQSSVEVAPGAGNFVDVPLTLTTFGTVPGSYTFTVTATNFSDATSTAQGTLAVLDNGVNVYLDRSSGAPGDTYYLTVINTGNVEDTYDLTLGGPAALVASLETTTVTLAPGDSQVVAITTDAVNFATPGDLLLA